MGGGWSLEFTKEAEDDLRKFGRQVRRRIINKLEWLERNFDSAVPAVLSGDFRGLFKLRVGDWRVIYRILWDRKVIMVLYIDRRDKIYKKK